MVHPPFSCLCLSFTFSWVGVVWSQVCGSTCSSRVLGSSGVLVAPFCRLSLWPHPLLLFYRLGFLPWEFVRTWVGRLQSCLGSYLLLGENSFPCPGFLLGSPCRLVVQAPGIFLESLLGFFPLASMFAAGLRWFRLLLGCPTSVTWQWRFFVGFLSASPRGATVPLDSLVLWCSWSSRWVTCLR